MYERGIGIIFAMIIPYVFIICIIDEGFDLVTTNLNSKGFEKGSNIFKRYSIPCRCKLDEI